MPIDRAASKDKDAPAVAPAQAALSPLSALAASADWDELLTTVVTAAPELLVALIRQHAWDVVWPALDEPARAACVQALPDDDKRLLLTLLFRRMREYASQAKPTTTAEQL